MGSAGSIECTPYDETKFLQSKSIMESTADDAEKFAQLKSIWAECDPPAAANETSEMGRADGDVHAPKESENNVPKDGETLQKDGENIQKEDDPVDHKEEHQEQIETQQHNEGEECIDHKMKEANNGHTEVDKSHQEEIHVQKEENLPEGTREAPKISFSASTGSLPNVVSQHCDEKVSKEL